MIRLSDALWIGDSDDGYKLAELGADAVLNVANDLVGQCSWPDVEYAQVGLIDGPGNEVSAYCAAILELVSLCSRHTVVAVYDHDGGRALAVVMMYLNLVLGKYRRDPLSWSHWLTWDQRLAEMNTRMTDVLPSPHAAHRDAFARIPFGVLEALL